MVDVVAKDALVERDTGLTEGMQSGPSVIEMDCGETFGLAESSLTVNNSKSRTVSLQTRCDSYSFALVVAQLGQIKEVLSQLRAVNVHHSDRIKSPMAQLH